MRKLKLNTRSLTETELVSVDMFMPEMLWSLHFIQAQGYDAECVGPYQDNISTQLLIKNGKMSSGKKTKHIKTKFFFIKDRVDDGEVKVLDCPIEKMWADLMIKLLQGTACRVMRADVMNCDVNYKDPPEEEESESVLSPKTVSWKSIASTTFKTPHECAEQSRIPGILWRWDTRKPRGIPQQSLGVARLVTPTWQKKRGGRE